MITEIFVNGDSYSDSDPPTIPYSKFLGDITNLPVKHYAKSGSSNDRIFRTTLEYCAGLLPYQRPLVIVGFTFVIREESWVENAEDYASRVKDYPGSKFVSSAFLKRKDIDAHTFHSIIDQNINPQMVNFYTKLFMLTQTLKQANLPYFLFSAADNKDFKNLDWTSLTNLNMYKQLKQDSNVADMHNFNIGVWADNNNVATLPSKHLYTNGHKQFADFLYTKVVQNYLT